MQALIKFIVIITLAALGLSGSSACAADEDENSFVAIAKLNKLNLVPPIFSESTGELTLEFRNPGVFEVQGEINPWRLTIRRPGENILVPPINIRLYFGQRFTNGQPIATLCDADIGKECPKSMIINSETQEEELDNKNLTLELRDIQFEPFPPPVCPGSDDPDVKDTGRAIANRSVNGIDESGRVKNNETGFKLIKDLIMEGLIYVVVDSQYKAKKGPDCDGDSKTADIFYTPRAPDPDPTNPGPEAIVIHADLTTPTLSRIVDGIFRGTLCLDSHKKCDRSLP